MTELPATAAAADSGGVLILFQLYRLVQQICRRRGLGSQRCGKPGMRSPGAPYKFRNRHWIGCTVVASVLRPRSFTPMRMFASFHNDCVGLILLGTTQSAAIAGSTPLSTLFRRTGVEAMRSSIRSRQPRWISPSQFQLISSF